MYRQNEIFSLQAYLLWTVSLYPVHLTVCTRVRENICLRVLEKELDIREKHIHDMKYTRQKKKRTT